MSCSSIARSADATEKPRGARIEQRTSVSSVASGATLPTSAGRANSSASRPATSPRTPGDHSPRTATRPSATSARAESGAASPSAPSVLRAASIASRERSRRSWLSASSVAASSAASVSSSVVSSSSAGRASPILPAALIRGARVKPTTSTRCGPSTPALFKSARTPTGIRPRPFITLSAERTITRNSSATGTMSATPPIIASTESSPRISRRSGWSARIPWAILKARPLPARFGNG